MDELTPSCPRLLRQRGLDELTPSCPRLLRQRGMDELTPSCPRLLRQEGDGTDALLPSVKAPARVAHGAVV
jgi:hypothetical protein